MNNLLILTSFLFIFSMKINAYEYRIYLSRNNTDEVFYFDNTSGELKVRYNNNIWNNSQFYITLYDIKVSSSTDGYLYINKTKFENYLKNDLQFLNDFYTQELQPILNYFYNDNTFTYTNHVVYEDYTILYNSDGLAVESIVNGKWAGLYDGPDNSGYLYDEKGDLKYINGVPPSFFESSFNKLMRRFGINLQSIFIRKIFYPLLVLIFACVVFRSVIRMAFKAFLIRFYDKKIGQLEKRREKIENA